MLHASLIVMFVLVASALPACSLSAGGGLAHSTRRASFAVQGPCIEAQVQLPPTYRIVTGVEWTRADIDNGSWRVGAQAGYSAPPEDGSRMGWEATARMGFLRGRTGGTVDSGAFAGARVAGLLRVGEMNEAWQGDSLIEFTPLLVVDAGIDESLRAGQLAASEFSARVLFRIHFTSTLVP